MVTNASRRSDCGSSATRTSKGGSASLLSGERHSRRASRNKHHTHLPCAIQHVARITPAPITPIPEHPGQRCPQAQPTTMLKKGTRGPTQEASAVDTLLETPQPTPFDNNINNMSKVSQPRCASSKSRTKKVAHRAVALRVMRADIQLGGRCKSVANECQQEDRRETDGLSSRRRGHRVVGIRISSGNRSVRLLWVLRLGVRLLGSCVGNGCVVSLSGIPRSVDFERLRVWFDSLC